jgi:CO dehydrogenase maturation factor
MGKSIAVAGKGGIGKTTLSALLIKALQESDEKPILAIDADPDSNLATLLGLHGAESVGELREDILRDIKNFPAGMSKAAYVEAGLHEIIVESNGFDLITMGRGEGAGCYCYLNNLIRKFSDDLAPSYKWLIFDNEAGLEHLSRRTTQNVDALLVVVTENPLSLHSAKSIKDIVDQMGNRIRKTYAVTNMIKPRNKEKIEGQLKEIGLELLCQLPYDEKLEQMVFDNSSIESTDGLEIWESVMTIVETVRRM